MNDDLPRDLAQLRTLRVWHAIWLDRIERAIGMAEQRERELERRRAMDAVRAPDWVIEYGLNRDALPNAVHLGECEMVPKGMRVKGVDSDTARRAIAGGVKACTFCRPDTELGLLDG